MFLEQACECHCWALINEPPLRGGRATRSTVTACQKLQTGDQHQNDAKSGAQALPLQASIWCMTSLSSATSRGLPSLSLFVFVFAVIVRCCCLHRRRSEHGPHAQYVTTGARQTQTRTRPQREKSSATNRRTERDGDAEGLHVRKK